ncbi:hypothetical protein [Chelativorans sp.]|uniref:hypothetical protein n=1 Tax=Chelativorans sp. TaxID=2203393 RepID=UPI00281225A1|nr:hypothetical protein [Chelativorans sp.]
MTETTTTDEAEERRLVFRHWTHEDFITALLAAEAERDRLASRVAELEAENARLEERQAEADRLIEPFAVAAPYWQGFHDFQQITHRNHSIEVGHLRAARAYRDKGRE